MQPGRRALAVRPARSLAMILCGVAALGAASALPAAARTPATESAAFSLKPLSARDARTYASAFAAVREGRFETADALAKTVSDPLLIGRLTYAKLMHPDYAASYDELADWLERYRKVWDVRFDALDELVVELEAQEKANERKRRK